MNIKVKKSDICSFIKEILEHYKERATGRGIRKNMFLESHNSEEAQRSCPLYQFFVPLCSATRSSAKASQQPEKKQTI
jgi:hypothetical protein